MRISAIIPVYNGGAAFGQCLSSLLEASPHPDEIVVVADSDDDGSWQLAQQYGAQVVRLPERGGPARARNHGARVARGEILFFVDADVTVPANAISRIATLFRHEPDLAAVIGSYFAVQAIPWHWFYYFYSGLAFALVTARHLFRWSARQPA